MVKTKKNVTTDSPNSFDFSWKTQDKPQGKVFAKKRKPPPPNVSPKIVKTTAPTITSQPNNDNSAQHTNNDSPPKQQHIKRKQKKDKALAIPGQKMPAHEQKNYKLFDNRQKSLYVDTSQGKSVSEKVFVGGDFNDLEIHKYLVSNLEKMQFKKLTNVQGKSIPVIMSGKNTLIRSQTGSGKTLAYAVPIIDALQGINPRLKRTDGIQAIIVVPTRELALQTHELFTKINTFQWVVTGHLCGGENRRSEKERIRKGLNVLIGTPGRLLDHVLHTAAMKINTVRCLVLDEADRLLDMGFRKDIISLVEALDNAKTNPDYDPMSILKNKGTPTEETTTASDSPPLKNINSPTRQTVLLSATLTEAVSELAEFTMKEHVYIDALDQKSNAILDSFVIPDTVRQEFIVTYVKHRLFTLSALLVAKSRTNSKIFVFMASSQMVEFHHELFNKYLLRMPVNRGKMRVGNVALLEQDSDDSEDEEEVVLDTKVFKLHGSMEQKMRKEVFNEFRAAEKGILLCTDVAARGLDVPLADCIIQYTGPQTDEDYLHRVGRTGRAGKSGSAIIFLTHEEQDYISHLRTHRVFLKQRNPDEYLKELCDLMDENDKEMAATALQRRFETAVAKDKALFRLACFAYSTWSRFYNSYPVKMREFFAFKGTNLGHYVTSFALRDTPTGVAKSVRGQVVKVEEKRLNKKLANHSDNAELKRPKMDNRKKPRSLSLVTSEFSSGLEPAKKKKKK